jgi:hypothetical protein
MIIGTVKGDIHDIGNNLVGMMMERAGFEVINLGINNPLENDLRAIKEHSPDILGMSALLTTTKPCIRSSSTPWSRRRTASGHNARPLCHPNEGRSPHPGETTLRCRSHVDFHRRGSDRGRQTPNRRFGLLLAGPRSRPGPCIAAVDQRA